jgi:GTP-binding protein LepA
MAAIKGTPQLLAMTEKKLMEPLEIGVLTPAMLPVSELHAGQVGYIATGLKSVQDLDVGDTITLAASPQPRCCPATSP